MTGSLGLVFSNRAYVGLAGAVFGVMFILLSSLSEFVFFAPYFVFYIPADRILNFALIVTVSALSGLVIPMNVYLLKTIQKVKRVGGGFLGSLVGASAGACSCGPVGFSIVSTFGTIGGTATAFLTTYEIPLRILSIGILGFVLYNTKKSLTDSCKIK
ncbi:MAG: hypothetical protein EB164_00935 [Thaumarchaeota archaeon]|nr:hypothetical protein [Nitrososphaerota archaeon]